MAPNSKSNGALAALDPEEVLQALDRLDQADGAAGEDLSGPPDEPGVSGRPASDGGPTTLLRDMGMMLDENLVDDLMLLEGASFSIPVELASTFAPGAARAAGSPAPRVAQAPMASAGAAAGAHSLPGSRVPGIDRSRTASLESSRAFFRTDAASPQRVIVWGASGSEGPRAAHAAPGAPPVRAAGTDPEIPAFLLEPPPGVRRSAPEMHAEGGLSAPHTGSQRKEESAGLACSPAAGRAAHSPARRPVPAPWALTRTSQALPVVRQSHPYAALQGGELVQAVLPVSGNGFGMADDDGLGAPGGAGGWGGERGASFMDQIKDRLRIDDAVESVRAWLWKVQPWLRGLASLLLPGWGQTLNGHPRKAKFFRIASFVTLVAADLVLFRERVALVVSLVVTLQGATILHYMGPIALVGGFLWLLSAYDALVVASTRRAAEQQRPRAL